MQQKNIGYTTGQLERTSKTKCLTPNLNSNKWVKTLLLESYLTSLWSCNETRRLPLNAYIKEESFVARDFIQFLHRKVLATLEEYALHYPFKIFVDVNYPHDNIRKSLVPDFASFEDTNRKTCLFLAPVVFSEVFGTWMECFKLYLTCLT